MKKDVYRIYFTREVLEEIIVLLPEDVNENIVSQIEIQDDPSIRRVYSKSRSVANKKNEKKQRRAKYEKNKDKIIEKVRAYQKKHKKKLNAYQKEYARKKREKEKEVNE